MFAEAIAGASAGGAASSAATMGAEGLALA
jgi:hypothetical protein